MQIYACLILFLSLVELEAKKCVNWTPKFVDFDGPSMIYTEALNKEDGIGTQLYIFAMLWMLRRTYNVDVFMSQTTFETLSQVFTEESLKDIPILEEYFCNPLDIQFEYYTGNFETIDARQKEFRQGRTLFLWPSKQVLVDKTVTGVTGDNYDTNFRGYK